MEIIKERYDYAIPLIVAFVLLFNILTIMSIYWRNDRDQLVRFLLMFVANLSISDLLVGVMLLINTILYHQSKQQNPQYFQQIWKIVTLMEGLVMRVTLIVSGVTMVTMTLIRVMALTETYFRYRINRKLVLNINTAFWISGALFVGVYNSVFEFYFNKKGYDKYEKAIIPTFALLSILMLLICHVIILRILQSHSNSMFTYLQTLRHYVSSRKTISARHLFTASIGPKSNNKKKKKGVIPDDNSTVGHQNHGHDLQDEQTQSHEQIQQQQFLQINEQQQKQAENQRATKRSDSDKKRCKDQVKFLFGTKDISLLRLELVVYVICWFPLALLVLLHMLDADLSWYTYIDMEQYLKLLVFMKSVFAPCAYLVHAKHKFTCFKKPLFKSGDVNTLDSSSSIMTTTII